MQEISPVLTNAFVGVACSAATLLITLYIKDSAKTIAESTVKNAQEGIKKDISAALSTFKDDLLRTMDITYRRSAECTLMMEQSADLVELNIKRLDAHENTVRDLYNFSRKNHNPKES